MGKRRDLAAISLITLAVLMLELTLTRVFSATMYYHFAFLAISLALFGSGASGVFVYLIQNKIPPGRTTASLAAAAVGFALSTPVALWVILRVPLSQEIGRQTIARLFLIYSASALPFFFAGCVISLAITRWANQVNRLYLFDLAGASAGCLLLIPVINSIGGINTVLLVSVIASASALLFSVARAPRGFVGATAFVFLGALGLFAYNLASGHIDIRTTKGGVENDVLFSKWNSFSRITVRGNLEAGAAVILIDSDAATKVVRASEAGNARGSWSNASWLVYLLKRDPGVLVIGPGGGVDVATALASGHPRITAVEVNGIIANDVMSAEPFKSYSGSLYQRPDVRLVVDEGRSFLRSHPDRYDVIQATMVDTWAATSAGAFTLTENNLYTVEAFKDYIRRLRPDGILSMTRWYFEPPDQALRLISIMRVAMQTAGITSRAARHMMLVRDTRNAARESSAQTPTPVTFLFKKSPFTDEEIRTTEAAALSSGFQILYTALTRPPNAFTKLIESAQPDEVWRASATNIEPTWDNNPFFFNSVRLRSLGSVFRGTEEWRKTNLGTFVLIALLGITAALVVLFIVGPLLIAGRAALAGNTRTKLAYLFYFGCLGAGFIIVEIAMIQKFILFLGHPVYALTVVLFSLLLFSAIGSSLSGRFHDRTLEKTLVRILLALIALVLFFVIVLPPLFYGLVGLSRPFRIAIAVALLAPLGLIMGMPMPSGIRILSRRAPDVIPWAWGLNGATSVMGSAGALSIALFTGFNQALATGAALYLLAALSVTLAGARALKPSPVPR